MHISPDRLKMVLRKVGVLREQLGVMCVGQQGPVLSVMDLHYVVEQVYGLSIDMTEVSFQAVYLRGHVERFKDNRANVRVRANLPEVDKRLTTVKELCHLVVDETDDWSSDAVATLDAIIADSRSRLDTVPKKAINPLESEALALLAALELSYPYEYRASDMEKLSAGETTVSAIALQHEVPPFVIEEALMKEHIFAPLRQEALHGLGLAAE